MGINIIWDEKYTHIIHLVVKGSWIWDDFHIAMADMHQQMDGSPHGKIEFIIDMREGQMLPKNVLTHMRKMSNSRHTKSSTMIIVGAGTFAKLLFDVMAKTMPERMEQIYLVEKIEKAYEIILFQRDSHSTNNK